MLTAGSDKFELSQILIQDRQSFLDYVFGGTQLGLQIAIDFTASNNPVHLPNSLHFLGGTGMNQYESAIAKVGKILQRYDADGQIPVYGFGGSIAGNVSHNFALNGNIFAPEVQGVSGVHQAYRNAI